MQSCPQLESSLLPIIDERGVAASAGIKYFDLIAYMKRSEAGAWTVQKVVDEGK